MRIQGEKGLGRLRGESVPAGEHERLPAKDKAAWHGAQDQESGDPWGEWGSSPPLCHYSFTLLYRILM